jgi:intracellular sulfur oxidation DsrE/DsrF family protein
MALTEAEINTLGSVLMGKLCDLSIQKKCRIASKAGIDISEVPSVQKNALVDPALARAFAKLDAQRKLNSLPILAERISAENGGSERDELTRLLEQHGYQYIDGVLVPVGLIDAREVPHLPEQARSDLSRAMTFLADGDNNDVAVALAGGAVDKVIEAIYKKNNWQDRPNCFQAGVNTAMQRLRIFEEMEEELTACGIDVNEAKTTAREMADAINHAAQALQVIRKTQGVAHGSRPTHSRMVYDTIKWASAICGLLEGKA